MQHIYGKSDVTIIFEVVHEDAVVMRSRKILFKPEPPHLEYFFEGLGENIKDVTKGLNDWQTDMDLMSYMMT